MSNVYTLRNRRFPNDVKRVLRRLADQADDPDRPLDGVAFIAFIDDHGFITDAIGRARAEPTEARRMLAVLDAKLARMEAAL